MTSLQGITVAIALSGIKYFNSIVLGPALVNKLANMTPLVEVIHTGEITYQEYIPPHGSGTGTNPGQPWIGTYDAAITLSSGQLHSFNPQIQSISQGEDGEFVLTIVRAELQRIVHLERAVQLDRAGLLVEALQYNFSKLHDWLWLADHNNDGRLQICKRQLGT